MSLSSQEAAESLSQAEQAGRRSAQVYFYHRSSPHLILWGTIWIFGYGGCQFFPAYANWIWGPLIVIGVATGVLIGHRNRSVDRDCASRYAWRMAALAMLIVFFIFSTYTIMAPTHGVQFACYPALITGTAYTAVGLWVGMRYVVTGILVMALTLFGYFYLQEYIALWLAFVGGGSMILAGLWFRTV